MIRVCIVALMIGWGYHKGGWWGAYSMLLISAVILCALVGGIREAEGAQAIAAADEDVPARRGRRVDPTRPTHEDYAAMTTNNFKGRKK